MNSNEYQELAERTECNELEASMRTMEQNTTFGKRPLRAAKLTHAAFGLSSEVGEFNDALKKWLYYGQELDETNLAEELGDLLWYVALACNALSISMEDVMTKNIAKLRTRYPEKYEDVLATEENRDRDAERDSLEQKMSKDGDFDFNRIQDNRDRDMEEPLEEEKLKGCQCCFCKGRAKEDRNA